MKKGNTFPLIMSLFALLLFVLGAGGCGSDEKAGVTTTNAETMERVRKGEIVHLSINRSGDQRLEKFLSDALPLRIDGTGVTPIKTGEKTTVRDRMFPAKNGETPIIFDPYKDPGAADLLKRTQTDALTLNSFIMGRSSSSTNIMDREVPLRNALGARIEISTRTPQKDLQKKSTFRTQATGYVHLLPITTDLGEVSIARMRTETYKNVWLHNRNSETGITMVTHDVLQQTIPGIEVVVEDPTSGTAVPPQSSKLFKIIFRPYDTNAIVPGNYSLEILWTPYSSEGVGGSATQTIHLTIMEALYETEFFERSGKDAIVGETEGLIGGKEQAGYVNDQGNLLTESMTAQIPFSYRKTGLTPDGNTRLLIRITSYLSNYASAQRFAVAIPYVEDLGFRIERLDGTLVTDGNYYGYVPAVDNGNGKYQATLVLVPPKDFGPYFSWPTQDLLLTVVHQSEISGSPGQYHTLDMGDHQFTVVPNPLVTIGGLWGNRTNVFGGPDGGNHARGLLETAYKPYFYPWSISEFLNWDGKGDLAQWTSDGARLSRLLDKKFTFYNDEGWACTQADILAYSMGGIFTWNYVNNTPDYFSPANYGNGKVHKLVSLGTPYLGTNMANFVLGDASYFYTDPNANPLTKVLCEYRRTAIISLHLLMQAYNSYNAYDMRRSYLDRSHQLEFFNGFFRFRDEDVIGAIKTARYGGMPLRSLHTASPMHLQMYGFYADLSGKLGEIMDMNPRSIPIINDALGYIESWRETAFPYQRVGDIPLGMELYDDLKKFLMGEPESLFVAEKTPDMLGSFVTAAVPYVPRTATMDDLLVFFHMIFGGRHDTTSPIDSSEWFFDPQNRYLFENYSHQDLPTSVPMAEIFFNNLLRAANPTPSMIFKKFDGTPLNYDAKIGPPRNYTMPTLETSGASFSAQPVSRTLALVRGDGWIRVPEETESLTAQLLYTQDVVAGQVVVIWGTVPPGTPDDEFVHINIIGVDNDTYTSKATVTVGEEYLHYFAFKKPGVYQIQARLHSDFAAASQDVSPKLDLVVMPPVTTITGLAFYHPFYLDYGEETTIDGLIVTDEETGGWNVSNPLYGTVYSVDNPALIQLEGNTIKGIGEGTTTIHATFRGYTASTQIQVRRTNSGL